MPKSESVSFSQHGDEDKECTLCKNYYFYKCDICDELFCHSCNEPILDEQFCSSDGCDNNIIIYCMLCCPQNLLNINDQRKKDQLEMEENYMRNLDDVSNQKKNLLISLSEHCLKQLKDGKYCIKYIEFLEEVSERIDDSVYTNEILEILDIDTSPEINIDITMFKEAEARVNTIIEKIC